MFFLAWLLWVILSLGLQLEHLSTGMDSWIATLETKAKRKPPTKKKIKGALRKLASVDRTRVFVVCFSSAQNKRDDPLRIEQARLGTGGHTWKDREEKLELKSKSIRELRVVGRGFSVPSGSSVKQKDNRRYVRVNSYLIPKLTQVSFDSLEQIADECLDSIMNFQII